MKRSLTSLIGVATLGALPAAAHHEDVPLMMSSHSWMLVLTLGAVIGGALAFAFLRKQSDKN